MNVVRILTSFQKWEDPGQWQTLVRYASRNHVCEGSQNATVLKTFDSVQTDSGVTESVQVTLTRRDPPGTISCVMPTTVETGFERSFSYKGWVYKISKTWAGRTLVDAQSSMETSATACSFWASAVRLEADDYIQKNSNSYVACSVLLKVSSLFAHQARIELSSKSSSEADAHGGDDLQIEQSESDSGSRSVVC